MVEPKMRFKGFEGEWRKIKFVEHILSIQTGTNLLGNLQNNGTPLLKMGNLQRGFFILDKLEYLDEQTKIEPQNMVYYGDFFFNTRNTLDLVGKGATWTGESGKFAFNSNIARFNFKNINTIFYNYLYNTPKVLLQVRARAMGTTSVAAIYPNSLNSITYYLPYKAEQQQIASYFKSLDILIQSTTKKIASLNQLKSASLISMFPQVGETKPRVRFKGFKEDWKVKKLCEISKKVTTKNRELKYNITLTNSAECGIISQLDFFNHKISNNNSISSYYVVENDDFVYNPRISATAPVGPISRNRLGYTGVMSPLYYVFKVYDIDNDYLSYFFQTRIWHKYMFDNGNSGARFDRLSITDDIFGKMPIISPTDLAEQRQIASFFRSLDTQIFLETQRLEKLKQIKSACLDKMFV